MTTSRLMALRIRVMRLCIRVMPPCGRGRSYDLDAPASGTEPAGQHVDPVAHLLSRLELPDMRKAPSHPCEGARLLSQGASLNRLKRSEESSVGKECRSRW